MPVACIYHLALQSEWENGTSDAYTPSAYKHDGFVHCSRWPQLRSVATRYYSTRTDMVVLEIRTDAVGAELVQEDTTGRGETFPHLYGSIPRAAIRSVLSLSWTSGGNPFFLRGVGKSDQISLVPVRTSCLDELALMNAMLREDEGFFAESAKTEAQTSADHLDRLVERFDGWIREGQQVELIRVAGEREPGGYLVLDPLRTPAYLRQLFVQRGMRRRGIGRAAVDRLMQRYGSQEMDVAYISGNVPAKRFWRSMGFAPRSVMSRRPASGGRTGKGPAGSGGAAGPDAVEFEQIVGDTHKASIFITDGLKSFNDTVSEHHKAAREPGAVQEIAVMISSGGRWVGGICGNVAWGWLEVDDLWVSDEFRGKGYGSQLLRRLERMGADRGAGASRLTTFSFQARPFYERHGYRVVGTMEGIPPGGAFYWMRKDGLTEATLSEPSE